MFWLLIVLVDFILEFRFEYVWPAWLFIQSVYETFKYQGLVSCGLEPSDILKFVFEPQECKRIFDQEILFSFVVNCVDILRGCLGTSTVV